MPSVLMSALLLSRLAVIAEVGAQRLGDQCRQRHLGLDGPVLDLLDQPGRQVHVALVRQGLSNSDIARELRIAKSTVDRHIANILAKLGVVNRTAAVRAWDEKRRRQRE